jgi:pyruvate/2-oxoglutarate dehydrogenase complex dihydrolipoamide dehydrogenase (E3) component
VIWGEATIDAAATGNQPGQVTVRETTRAGPPKGALGPGAYQAKHIIVATGARPRVLPGIEPDKKLIWTYYEAMVPPAMPKSLLVMGSGAIGIEFASFYRTMGAEVTVIELLPQILPVEDAEIAAHARKRFEKQGIKILTGAKVTKVEKGPDSVTATIDDGKATQTIAAERLISAVGVVGNVENLGLEKLGVTMDRGTVVTDGLGRTNVPGLYAIGDVAGPPMLAHKAEHEGVICVETIKGLHTHAMDKGKIPGCTYCHPQIASVGSRGQGERAGARYSGRPLPLSRQRQGHRAGRAGRARQDDFRQEDRPAPRSPYGRGRGDGADPGLRGRHEPRNHRGRADAHGFPASDALRNDARERSRRVWAGYPHLRSVLPQTGERPRCDSAAWSRANRGCADRFATSRDLSRCSRRHPFCGDQP